MTASVELDVPGALNRIGGDRETLLGLLHIVTPEIPNHVRQIETALEQADFAGVELGAHSLRGSTSNVGCPVVEKKAREIEELARAQDSAGIARELERLDQLVQQMMLKFDELRRSLERELRTA